jgi:2-polyprenyl-6-hydroxyphenyl methylase/3-demethylubiquinone-9 3-methyltransferase
MRMLVKDYIDQPIIDTNVNVDQIARFEALADEWWKPDGKFRVMHGFNDARRGYIAACIAEKFQRDLHQSDALSEISILDVGCGGGLISEPLASMRADVIGVDATSRNIEIAKRHARQTGVDIDYRHGTANTVVAADELFDVVLSLEVIEHVDNPQKLITDCAAHLKPGGMMIVATLNRTLRALILAILGAEYVLRWLPVGTHDWRRFLKPREIELMLADEGLGIEDIVGVTLNPLNRTWKITPDPSVNYMLVAGKATP